MADDDKKDEQELSEDEKLAAEWEAAMDESGDAEGSREDEWAAAMAEAEGGDDQPEAEHQDVRTAPMEEFGAASYHRRRHPIEDQQALDGTAGAQV